MNINEELYLIEKEIEFEIKLDQLWVRCYKALKRKNKYHFKSREAISVINKTKETLNVNTTKQKTPKQTNK